MSYKVVFISNYLTIHQISLCREFYEKLGNNFTFISSFEPSGDKIKYSYFEEESFVLRSYISRAERENAIKRIDEADIVIFGSGDRTFLKNKKKIIFFYSEHLSKARVNFLRKLHLHMLYKKFTNSYLLCASCFSQIDFNHIGLFNNRCLYFGYFPLLEDFSLKTKQSDDRINLLWVGRELELKHPEYAFRAAQVLYENGISCNVKIISSCDGIIKELLERFKIEPWIKFIEILSPTDNPTVQNLMYKSDIFIFSSDRREGWGAVVNEAMNAECCPIVSNLAGCSRFLIEDGVNGYVFSDMDEFEKKLIDSARNNSFSQIGVNAARTIHAKWNAKNAVTNLLLFFDVVIQNKEIPINLINNGPGTKIV